MKNEWSGEVRHAMDQADHEKWNASHYPGTRQLCCECEQETDRCEEDEIYLDCGIGPLCIDCYRETDEYKRGVSE